jgi:glycosyltransferase involved in cell wall biosynthesis
MLASTPAHLLKYRQGQRLVLLSMWESANLPEAFRDTLHLFDTIIVPSQQNVELFSEFHPDVRMVPLGIDPDVWTPTRRQMPVQRFTFLIGGSGDRKGVDLAYHAFREAFPTGSWGDGPEPWLIQKSPKVTPFHGDRIMQINGRLSAEDEVALYASAHCYLQPSRGEGFGLQPLQAIAQGCPTILTDAHGHASFAHLGIGIPAALKATKPGSFMLGEAGDWWEPDLDALIEAMREVYDNYELACEQAWAGALAAQTDFTWEQTARKILAILQPLKPYEGSGEWCKPEYKLFRIILNRHHSAEHAGMAYTWEPFTEYFVPSDLKRVLFEGGYLDPSCVFGDAGIAPERITESGLKTGAESTCGTCGQVLNSQPTRADRLEAEWAAQ